jgi:hypothetical protein
LTATAIVSPGVTVNAPETNAPLAPFEDPLREFPPCPQRYAFAIKIDGGTTNEVTVVLKTEIVTLED